MIVVRTSESWPEFRMSANFLVRWYQVYTSTRIRETEERYVAHHSSILQVRTTAVSITACVQRSLAETRPLYSRRRPCRRKVLCTCYISKSVRRYENLQYIYTSPCTQKPWSTDARQTKGVTCAHGSMVHELALIMVLLVSYSVRTADGSEVSPDYRRKARADAITYMPGKYDITRKYHAHPDASFSW